MAISTGPNGQPVVTTPAPAAAAPAASPVPVSTAPATPPAAAAPAPSATAPNGTPAAKPAATPAAPPAPKAAPNPPTHAAPSSPAHPASPPVHAQPAPAAQHRLPPVHHAGGIGGVAAIGVSMVTGAIGHAAAQIVIKEGLGIKDETNLEKVMETGGAIAGGIGGTAIGGPVIGTGVGVFTGELSGLVLAKGIEQSPLAVPANAAADGIVGAVDNVVDHVEKGFEGIKDGVVGVFAGDHRHDAAPTGISAAAPPVDLHAGAAGAGLTAGVHKKKHHYKNHKKMHAHDPRPAALPPLARPDSRRSARSEIIVTPLPPPAEQAERVSAAATDASKQRFAPATACPVTPGA